MRVVRKEDIAQPFRGTLGELIYELFGAPERLGSTRRHSVAHVVVPPDRASPAHYHKVSEETYFVLAGEGQVRVGDQSGVLRPGDACLIMPGLVHEVRNEGAVPLEFITVSAPPWTPDDMFLVEAPDV